MSERGRLPDFIIIGSMKAGTTSLYEYLRVHPDVFMPSVKELDFFVSELNWRRGLDWYASRFASAPNGTACVGEASTSYTKYPRYEGVPGRIRAHLPDVRLVYSVRDPVERVRSHHQHNVKLGEEREPIDRAIRNNPAYLDYTRYATQIERYLEHFPRDRILVITAEALRHDRRATVARVCDFLGIRADLDADVLEREFYTTSDRPTYGRSVAFVRNALRRAFPSRVALWRGTYLARQVKRTLGRPGDGPGGGAAAVPVETASFIRAELEPEIDRLRRYLDEDLDAWGLS
jgi:Sulfotransferase domain